jgi:hypothetical protein
MIDEDDISNPHHEHVQDTTTRRSKEIVDETVHELSLKDPTEECFAQFEFDLDLDMIHEQAQAFLDPIPGMRTKNGETAKTTFPNPFPSAAEPLIIENNEEEKKDQVEHIEPPTTPSLSNDMEMSTKAHSFVTIPFETLHEPQAPLIQCLKEPFYAKALKDLCKQAGKPRNHHSKKILLSKKVGYFKWQNILPEGYQILKKKGWKGLVGHPHDPGKVRYSFFFYTLFLSHFISSHFIFVSNSN